MPRYFFNIYDDVVVKDDEGMELPNLEAARLQALNGARDLIATQVRHGYMERSHWLEVEDAAGEVLLNLTFAEAVEIRD